MKRVGYHFHGAVKGIPLDDLVNYEDLKKEHKINKSIIEAMEKGKICYQHITFENLGWTVLSPFDNYFASANYIIKYVSKAPCKTDKNRIYIRSRGLKFADTYELPCVDLEYLFRNSPGELKRIYKSEDKEADYIHSLDFNFDFLSSETKLELFTLFSESQKK